MKLYFIRHGQTKWNAEGRIQGGEGDSPLLPEALEDLKKLGKTLSTVQFDQAYASDLTRAKTTADIIMAENQHPIPVVTKEELREWHLGSLEGQKFSIMQAIYPKQMEAFLHNLARFDHDAFDAESVYHLTHRIGDFIKSLDTSHDTILIVGHGAALTASIHYLLGYDQAKLRQDGGLDNGSITILETADSEHFDLITWNDTSYLD